MDIKEILETLKNIRETHKDSMIAKGWTVHVSLNLEELDCLISSLEADDWVSVEEWLPESGKQVLLGIAGGEIFTGCCRHDDVYVSFYSDDDGDPQDNVTHWRPLPAPPKDGK